MGLCLGFGEQHAFRMQEAGQSGGMVKGEMLKRGSDVSNRNTLCLFTVFLPASRTSAFHYF